MGGGGALLKPRMGCGIGAGTIGGPETFIEIKAVGGRVGGGRTGGGSCAGGITELVSDVDEKLARGSSGVG